MKKYILILALFMGMTITGLGQDDDDKQGGGRVETLKIAYITQKLKLTPEEAQKFWPIYNQYIGEIRKARMELKNGPELDRAQKVLDIQKRYNGEFTKALNADKANQFFRTEKEWNALVTKEMMERRQNRLDKKNLRN